MVIDNDFDAVDASTRQSEVESKRQWSEDGLTCWLPVLFPRYEGCDHLREAIAIFSLDEDTNLGRNTELPSRLGVGLMVWA